MSGIHMCAMSCRGQVRIFSLMTVTYHMDILDDYEGLWLHLKLVQMRQRSLYLQYTLKLVDWGNSVQF